MMAPQAKLQSGIKNTPYTVMARNRDSTRGAKSMPMLDMLNAGCFRSGKSAYRKDKTIPPAMKKTKISSVYAAEKR